MSYYRMHWVGLTPADPMTIGAAPGGTVNLRGQARLDGRLTCLRFGRECCQPGVKLVGVHVGPGVLEVGAPAGRDLGELVERWPILYGWPRPVLVRAGQWIVASVRNDSESDVLLVGVGFAELVCEAPPVGASGGS